MNISIRKFEEKDITNKVAWINNSQNNTFLHYDLPLREDKTIKWFRDNKDRKDRLDAVIEANGIPVGLIGLLSIDHKNKKAEYYVTIGNRNYLGKGVARKASTLLLEQAFSELSLQKIYLYTECKNLPAQRLFEKLGFKKEGLLKNDLYYSGHFIDRFYYELTAEEFSKSKNKEIKIQKSFDTPLYRIASLPNNNSLFIKRDDLIPYSFGGNKARKAFYFFEEIHKEHSDYVITYGSSSSNHCRIIANLAAEAGLKCIIISPEEKSHKTYNSQLIELCGAKTIKAPLNEIHQTIEDTLASLRKSGNRPYFIQGGGHGNIGTKAYFDCFTEIEDFERKNNVHFDYIFHACGTGTTQAGLITGALNSNSDTKIIGISIARKNPKCKNVVLESVKDFLGANTPTSYTPEVVDDYIDNGYGEYNKEIIKTIKYAYVKYGIPLDNTYTAKAFWGMTKEIEKRNLENCNILFLHTGGTPLFFDSINNTQKNL